MSDSKKSSLFSVPCSKGSNCEFHKLGKCTFKHAPTANKNGGSGVARLYASQLMALKKGPVMKEDYVDVKSPNSLISAPPASDPMVLAAGLLRTAARAAIGTDKAKIILYAVGNSTTTGGGVLSLSLPLTVSSTSEWSSLAQLYDEVRVDKVIIDYAIGVTIINSSGMQEYAVGYDSTRNVTPSSIPDVLESPKNHNGVFHVGTCYSTADQSTSSRDGGYRVFPIAMQHNDVANAAAVTGGTGQLANFPGMWMDTQLTASNAYSTGYARFYSAGLGGTNVSQLRYILKFHCTFKERT